MERDKKHIPIFRPNYGPEEIGRVTKVLESGWIGLGPVTAEFETKFASYIGSKYAVALNSATSALHLALIAADVKKGDEVIVPALSFVSTAAVVEYMGAKPIFADIKADTLCLSPEDVAKKITKKTKVVVPVHYGGHPAELDKLNRLAKKHNFMIIEDAAHACGSEYKGKKIGSISQMTCFSFHAVKNLATGDGGMITTNNKKIAERLVRLRWMGIDKSTWGRIKSVTNRLDDKSQIYGWYYEIDELGYKYHMNDINAALGLAQLEKLEAGNEKRRDLARIYTENLSDIRGLECPPVHSEVLTSQHNYAIRYQKRDELHLFLRDEGGISTGVHYLPLHLQPFFRKRYPNVQLPVTEKEWLKILLLPLYPQMTKDEQAYIIDRIREYSKRSEGSKNGVKKNTKSSQSHSF